MAFYRAKNEFRGGKFSQLKLPGKNFLRSLRKWDLKNDGSTNTSLL